MLLAEVYGEIASALPILADDQEEATVFTVGSIPKPPPELETDGITLLRGRQHYSPAFVVDRAHMYAWPSRYQQLGLLCLGVLFHEDIDVVDLHLTDMRTELQTIRIRYESPRPDRYSGEYSPYPQTYNVTPCALQHWIATYRGNLRVYRDHERPSIELTNASEDWDVFSRQDDLKTHLVGFGEDQGGYGLATMAELFLNLGSPQEITQFTLELPGALGPDGGVAHWSAELRLYLPSDPAFATDGPSPGDAAA